jgi:hypothetical protein
VGKHEALLPEFLFVGVLLQGSLAQTSETAQAKIERALSAASPDIAKAASEGCGYG